MSTERPDTRGKWVFRNQRWYFMPGEGAYFEWEPPAVDSQALASLVDISELQVSLRALLRLFRLPMLIVLADTRPSAGEGAPELMLHAPQWLLPQWWTEFTRHGPALQQACADRMLEAARQSGRTHASVRVPGVFPDDAVYAEPIVFTYKQRRLLYGVVCGLALRRARVPGAATLLESFGIAADSAGVLRALLREYLPPKRLLDEFDRNLRVHVENYAARVREAYELRLELAAEQARSRNLLVRAENLEKQLLRGTAELEKAHGSSGVSARELAAILESPAIGVTIEDTSHTVRYQSPMLRRAFGSVVGRKCFEAFKGRREPCWPCPIHEIWDEGKESVRYTAFDSRSSRYYEVNAFPLVGEGGEKLIVEVGLEITPLLMAQERLKQQVERLKERGRQHQEMLSRLNGVLLDTATEAGQFLLGAALRRAGDEAPDAAAHRQDMVEGMAALVNRAGQVALALARVARPGPVDVAALARRLESALAQEPDSPVVRVRTSVMPRITCDAEGLEGILTALVRYLRDQSAGSELALDLSYTMSGSREGITRGDAWHVLSLAPSHPEADFGEPPASIAEVSGLSEPLDPPGSLQLTIASLLVSRLGGALRQLAQGERTSFFLSLPAEPDEEENASVSPSTRGKS